MKRTGYVIIALYAAIFCACGSRGDQTPTPRPAAYPRSLDPGSEYVAVDSMPIVIEVNSSAIVSRPGDNWLDISYPALNATVHLSITPVSAGDIDDIIANRSQRIALNLADAAGAAHDAALESDDFTSTLVVAPDARTTPLQFISTDGQDWVISGAAFFSGVRPDASVDSLSQAVGYIRRDLIHTLTHLSHDNLAL